MKAARAVSTPRLVGAVIPVALLLLYLQQDGGRIAALFVVGAALGVTLYHTALGFTGAYRRFFLDGDTSGLTAQLVMLAVAMVLFAPVLAAGEVFGHGVGGAVAPVGVSMVLGAFLFGIGMQLGGGCGSGTLFTAGGGDARMAVTLVFFCAGGFWGSLDLEWWRTLPEMPAVSLGQRWGYGPALEDVTSVMNVGIIAGAFGAAILAGRFKPTLRIPPRALVAAIIGGLMLGYGARLAYGCNIGAFFSGVASTSLHGWVWIAAALPGNWLGTRLRPWFGLVP